MQLKSLRTAATIASMLFLAACSETITVTETVEVDGNDGETPVAGAESPTALPQVIYYKISDS